jgi:hypothetical protein
MSENELKKALEGNKVLQEDLERVKSAIKTSEACAALQEYCTKTEDPLRDASPNNPLTAKAAGGGGGCQVL